MTALIRKLAEKIGANGLTNIIVSDVSGDKSKKTESDKVDVFTKIGVEILKQMLDLLEDDISVWFADLIGKKTKEEFDEMAFDIDPIIIEQLIESKEINSFFMHALRAFNKMKEFAGQAKTLKMM